MTRHTRAYLAAKYPPHNQLAPRLSNTHVGVDGSLRQPTAGLPAKGAGAAAYLTAEIDQHSGGTTLTAHIATCTYCGEQTVANSEYAGYALALQTLAASPSLRVGWDHLNAVELMHAEIPQAVPPERLDAHESTDAAQAPSQARASAQSSSFNHLASADHYRGNPHMALAHALTSAAIAEGKQRTAYKVEAHISREADAKIATLLDETATWDPRAMEYTVPDSTLRAVIHTIAATLDTRPQGTATQRQHRTRAAASATAAAIARPADATANTHHLSIALNTLADWGSKQVALKNKRPSVALPPNTLSPGKWCLVNIPPPPDSNTTTTYSSTVQQSDPTSVRKHVSSRVERAMQEAKLHPDPSRPPPTRLDTTDLWVDESTAILKRPSGKQAPGPAAMPPEPLTKHYCQMAYGSILYNADALVKDPDLAAAVVKGPGRRPVPFTTHCPLCTQPGTVPLGEDSLHHIYHTCTAQAVVDAKEALQVALTQKIREISDHSMDHSQASHTADLIMQRGDYYAGQISLGAHNIIAAARTAHALAQGRPPGLPGEAAETHPPATLRAGALQRIVLTHSKRIHDLRSEKIPTQLRLTNYRKAMWANQRRAALAARAGDRGAGLSLVDDGVASGCSTSRRRGGAIVGGRRVGGQGRGGDYLRRYFVGRRTSLGLGSLPPIGAPSVRNR